MFDSFYQNFINFATNRLMYQFIRESVGNTKLLVTFIKTEQQTKESCAKKIMFNFILKCKASIGTYIHDI